MTDTTQVAIRVPADLLAAIDRRAKDAGLSRNEWLVRCSRWAIHNLPFGADGPTRRFAAQNAPADVAGTLSEDMGLDTIEGRT